MAQHDFAPAWLNFPNPPSSAKSLNFEKNSENCTRSENRYDIGRRRHNSSDGFNSSTGRSNGGNFGRKEKNSWRSQARNGTENKNQRAECSGACSHTHSSTFHSGKSKGLHENNVPDNETGKKVVGEGPKQFEAEDFPSLNPEHEKGPNQNKSLAGGVWEYPLNPRSRSSRMLVIKKGIRKDLSLSGFHVVTSHSLPVKNGTSPSVYKGLVPKPAVPPIKPTQWKSQTKDSKIGSQLSHDSAYTSFNPLKMATTKTFSIPHNSAKECNRSNSSSPVDKLSQPRLMKLTRVRTDKKSEFLKALKQDRVEEEHEDGNHVEQEKTDMHVSLEDNERYDLHNSNNIHHERDTSRNLDENEENESDLISQQIIRSSTFPQADALSSSLEAEHRLLKEMGWQEYGENDETCAPLTEDEMREFQEISEQLQKNGLRKNGLQKDGLNVDFKFGFWKNSTFKPTIEIDDTETSSSDTSDDDV